MLLAIDVGNSHIVCGLFRDQTLRYHWRINTISGSTGDELAAQFQGLLTLERLSFEDVTGVIIASVVPRMETAWLTFSRKHLELSPLFVDEKTVGDLRILTDHPAEVGADRLVNAVAAYQKYGTALIIVDFGTAITFDCVSEEGDYLGGAILPGISISLDALAQRAAKLPRLDIATPPTSPIGTSTVAAIQSGILFGYGGMVDGLARRLGQEMAPAQPKVIATGGMAPLIAPLTEVIESVEPMLTLEGLRLLYERNE